MIESLLGKRVRPTIDSAIYITNDSSTHPRGRLRSLPESPVNFCRDSYACEGFLSTPFQPQIRILSPDFELLDALSCNPGRLLTL